MYLIDKMLLAPYWLTLKARHAMYDRGMKKSRKAGVPTIAVGNVTVGGTGKTPHTELIVRILLENLGYSPDSVAVLSRGYKRKTRGFWHVTVDGSARDCGDEPLQIKRKFPAVTVAVDRDRLHGAELLGKPEKIGADRKSRKCADKNVNKAEIIVLDDALQYRKLVPDVSIMLVDYNRPVFEDHLMPAGQLRDLPQRVSSSDIVIVTKSPAYIEEDERRMWREKLGMREEQKLFFTTTGYCRMEPVWAEGEPRYLYSKRLVLFSGIADDTALQRWLSDEYCIVSHLKYPDHHSFNSMDIKEIQGASETWPTSVIATTEKDSQRIKDVKKIPETLKQRMFRVPIEAVFVGEGEKERFIASLTSLLKESRSGSVQTPRE